jgi:hypothetical protein
MGAGEGQAPVCEAGRIMAPRVGAGGGASLRGEAQGEGAGRRHDGDMTPTCRRHPQGWLSTCHLPAQPGSTPRAAGGLCASLGLRTPSSLHPQLPAAYGRRMRVSGGQKGLQASRKSQPSLPPRFPLTFKD